jgi:transposase
MTSAQRKQTPSFVCEIPLSVSLQEEKRLLARLEAARQLYNACLGEALKRLALLGSSRLYQTARALPKGGPSRTRLFQEAREAVGFSDYSLQSFASSLRRCWLGEHLDANATQKLGTRAFRAVESLLFGKAKKVRFKGKNQLDSVEGKSNLMGIRFREGRVLWSGLSLRSLLDERDPVIRHGLSCRIKYVRLLRRKLRGENRFFAQLVCEGTPYQDPTKPSPPAGVVGLDLGPQTLAAVSGQKARLVQFCEALSLREKELRRLSRKLERQRRASNPQNYDEKGRIKPGKKTWKTSKRAQKTKDTLAELQRRQAAHRKALHGRLANELLTLGKSFQTEKLSYRSWQKTFGKSVGNRAPGMFVGMLRRKAASAGGALVEFPTRSTKLSRTCHCGKEKKKTLSERWHDCECGVSAQRDLYSAFLARFVEGKTLNASQAASAWPGAKPLLRMAFEESSQRARGRKLPSSFGSPPRSQSPSSEKGRASYDGGKATSKNQLGFPFW